MHLLNILDPFRITSARPPIRIHKMLSSWSGQMVSTVHVWGQMVPMQSQHDSKMHYWNQLYQSISDIAAAFCAKMVKQLWTLRFLSQKMAKKHAQCKVALSKLRATFTSLKFLGYICTVNRHTVLLICLTRTWMGFQDRYVLRLGLGDGWCELSV